MAKLKAKIQNFEQLDSESLYEAWMRFKTMLQECPLHDLNAHQIMQTFYNGLDVFTRQAVDAPGPLIKKLPNEARTYIEQLAEHSHQWHATRDPSRRKTTATGGESEEIPALKNQVEVLAREFKKMGQTVHAMQVGCDNCGGPHLKKDCDLDDNGNKKAEVCFSSADRNPNWRSRGEWKPWSEYQKERADKYRQSAPGFYQKQPLEQPVPQEKHTHLEELVTKFVESSDRKFKLAEESLRKMGESFDKRLREIGTSTETTFRNQQASILNIEAQVGRMSQLLQERLPGAFPSNTEKNPNAQPGC